MGEQTAHKDIAAVPWSGTVGWVWTVVHADGHLFYESDLPCVFKSERIPVGSYAVPNMVCYVVDKKVVSIYNVLS